MEEGVIRHRKVDVREIITLSKFIVKDPKKSNAIVDIIAQLESEDEAVVTASIHGIARIFGHLLTKGDMHLTRPPSDQEHLLDRSVEEKYALWLQEHYRNTVTRLVEFFASDRHKLRELALSTLMKFVALEGKRPLTKISKEKLHFPVHILEKVILGMLSELSDMKGLIGRFQEFLNYADVKFHTLKIMKLIVKGDLGKDVGSTYLDNCYTLMKSLTFPCEENEDGKMHMGHNLCHRTDIGDPACFKFDIRAGKQIFSIMWTNFLKRKLPGPLYRKLLLGFDENILPCMESPLLMADFLMDSYNLGGVVSLLALNGLFVLMVKHNLEFPDFYKHLYALFKPDIFYTKYRARFFFLADIFLSSTHLTEYLVAAFAKRLSRISLTAPPHCLLLIIPFIQNLLLRHRGLSKLIHNPSGPKEMDSDPFLQEEQDPMKCNAMESSLWEIKTLQNHYFPKVARTANFIETNLPKIENDLSQLLELNSSELIAEEVKKKVKKEVPLTFQRPSGLFTSLKELWTL